MAETSNSAGQRHAEGDEKGVTMLEVLEGEQELEEDANAVLGGSDDQHCTYTRGYIKRQALYACMTCVPSENDQEKKGGICLACSYYCHEDHELVELYTKRNFRCDCGNINFPSKCTLEPDKVAENKENSYNDNFKGIYCTCKRPYPDPDDDTDDEMIQCIMCEDWFHGRHLGNSPPTSNYSEMVCAECMSHHKFLQHYIGYSVSCKSDSSAENSGEKVDVMPLLDSTNQKDTKSDAKENDEGGKGTSSKKEGAGSSKETEGCKLVKWKASPSIGATYWGQGWRKILCTCLKCKDMYVAQKVEFLLDEEDPVQVYEEEGKAKECGSSSQYEEGLRALSSLGHVQKVDAIQEYTMMQAHLKDYLKKFADNKKVVREEDIREFFSEMESRKKQRQDVHVQHFCH